MNSSVSPRELVPTFESGRLTPRASSVPVPAMAFATSLWLALTLAASHLGAPTVAWLLGGVEPAVAALFVHGHAFALVSGAVVALLLRTGLTVDLDRKGLNDPTAAATVGGLLGWAAIQLVAPGADLVASALVALVESVGLGFLFSSITSRSTTALGLGLSFQLLVSGLSALVLGIF